MTEAKKTPTQVRKEKEERQTRKRSKLIESAKAGDKNAARELTEQYNITKVYSQKEIDERS